MQPATFFPQKIFSTFEVYLQTAMKNILQMSVQLVKYFFSYSVHMQVFVYNLFRKGKGD